MILVDILDANGQELLSAMGTTHTLDALAPTQRRDSDYPYAAADLRWMFRDGLGSAQVMMFTAQRMILANYVHAQERDLGDMPWDHAAAGAFLRLNWKDVAEVRVKEA